MVACRGHGRRARGRKQDATHPHSSSSHASVTGAITTTGTDLNRAIRTVCLAKVTTSGIAQKLLRWHSHDSTPQHHKFGYDGHSVVVYRSGRGEKNL